MLTLSLIFLTDDPGLLQRVPDLRHNYPLSRSPSTHYMASELRWSLTVLRKNLLRVLPEDNIRRKKNREKRAEEGMMT
jgi:hypothetical protein